MAEITREDMCRGFNIHRNEIHGGESHVVSDSQYGQHSKHFDVLINRLKILHSQADIIRDMVDDKTNGLLDACSEKPIENRLREDFTAPSRFAEAHDIIEATRAIQDDVIAMLNRMNV